MFSRMKLNNHASVYLLKLIERKEHLSQFFVSPLSVFNRYMRSVAADVCRLGHNAPATDRGIFR